MITGFTRLSGHQRLTVQVCEVCGARFTRRAANTLQVRCAICQAEHKQTLQQKRERERRGEPGENGYQRKNAVAACLESREWTLIHDPLGEMGGMCRGAMLGAADVHAMLTLSTFTAGTRLCNKSGQEYVVVAEKNQQKLVMIGDEA